MIRVSSYIKKYWYYYIFGIICMSIQVGLDMLSPQVTKRIIDDVIGKEQLDLLPFLLMLVLGIGVGRCVFGYLKEYVFDNVGSKIAIHLRRNLFNHIQGLSVNFFDKTNTGELMSRLKDDIDRIWGVLVFISMLMIEVVMHTVIVLLCMFGLNRKLFLIPITVLPIVGVIAVIMERKLNTVYEEISEENATLNTVAQENIAGVRTVKAFAREKFEIQKFLSHNKRYYELNMKQSKVLIRYQPFFQIITRLLPLVVLMWGGYMVMRKEITLGTLGAFIEYSMNIVWPLEMIGWLSNDIASAFASNNKIKKIYEVNPMIREKEHPVKLGQVKGRVTFQNVSFSLEENNILKDISFDLKEGKTLGIMGATGAGKSSVISLLQRFYDANEGAIFLDGVNIKDLSLMELRKSVSLVMQDVFLFSDTVNENVKLGKRRLVTSEEVIEAVEHAQASEFVQKMDYGYDTVIGERGVGLSGGQKQRISIARALAKKAPILVLDDSTSALDMETEQMIQETLNGYRDTTKIIIAHRISSVKNADEILVLKNGRIAERGKHDELLNQKGLYYQTYMAQYGAISNEYS